MISRRPLIPLRVLLIGLASPALALLASGDVSS